MSKSWTREGGSQRHRRPSQKSMIIAVVAIIIAAITVVGVLFLRADEEVQRVLFEELPIPTEADVPAEPSSVQGRYLFNGTAVLARAVERDAGSDLSQPFSQLSTFNPDQYDAMTLDWECPSTDDVIPYEQQVQDLVFNCHTKWLPEVSKHFSIVSLANNHSGDLGEAAFQRTQKNLNEAGIQTYGNYNPAEERDVCEIIGLPIRIQMPDDTEKQGRLPIAFCSWHYFFRTPQAGEIEVMQRYAEQMPVFGFMHAGAEYYPTAAPDQEAMARKIIDGGAEFVIGNSPHWVQNSEVYKDKPIFYSTGNFIFDQIDAETMRGLSIDVAIEVPYSANTARWLELGDKCVALHDACLETAATAGLEKVSIDLTYDVVGSSGGARRVTQKADETLQRAIEERVNWQATREQLGQTN